MRNARIVFSLMIIGMLLSAAVIAAATDSMDPALMNGKKATFTFSTPHKFGGFTLKPGGYQFQHRVVNGEHFVYFTSLNGRQVSPGGVRCQAEPLHGKASYTAITTVAEGNSRRITRIAIGGEKFVHVFEPADDPFSIGVDLRQLQPYPYTSEKEK